MTSDPIDQYWHVFTSFGTFSPVLARSRFLLGARSLSGSSVLKWVILQANKSWPIMLRCWGNISLLSRPFFAGEEKTAWYNLFAHASNYPKSG